jgi:hypothetical protein
MTDPRDEHETYGHTHSPVIEDLRKQVATLLDEQTGFRVAIAQLTAERDEARRDAERWQADALRLLNERNTAERERNDAQRECCVRTVDAGGNPAHAPLEEAMAEAKRRGWKCYRTAEDGK